MTDEKVLSEMHGQTAQLNWSELERFFAAGKLLQVSGQLDLVEVAEAFASDRADRVSFWLDAGDVQRVNDDRARQWQAEDALLWTVVAAPWVLVQAAGERGSRATADPQVDV